MIYMLGRKSEHETIWCSEEEEGFWRKADLSSNPGWATLGNKNRFYLIWLS